MKFINKLFSAAKPSAHDFAEITLIGDRDINQDSLNSLFSEQGILLVVADGLGGHEAGELASRYFCEALIKAAKSQSAKLAKSPESTLGSLIEQATEKMRQRVHRENPGADAHTTCTIAWISLPDYTLTTVHIGDSRVYVFDKKKVIWRSRDHSVTQMLLDMGEITEDEMGTHPEQGSLTRSIGMDGELKPGIKTYGDLKAGQGILLCSDGFWEMITPKEICTLCRSNNIQEKLADYAALAAKRAGPDSDNVTAQLLVLK